MLFDSDSSDKSKTDSKDGKSKSKKKDQKEDKSEEKLSDLPSDVTAPPSESSTEAPPVPKDSVISRLFGTDLVNEFKCRCSEKMKRAMKSSLFDLVYPDITGQMGKI